MPTSYEDKIKEQAKPYLEPNERVLAAFISQPRVTLTVTVGPGTLAAGSVRIAGGRRTTLALAPRQATLQRLGTGRHAVTVLVVAVDQGRRSKRTSLSGYCVVGAHFKLVMLHVRR